MKCPRCADLPENFQDGEWKMDLGVFTCSACGSIHPDEFFKRVESGNEVIPTDKAYKVYVGPNHKKFYFQHLSGEQMDKFIELYNAKKMKIGEPGHFYVMPFFCEKGA